MMLTFGQIVYQRLVQCVGEGTFGIVGYSYTDSFPLATTSVTAEVEEVLMLVVDLLLYDGWCPSIAACPRGLVAYVEVDAFVAPVYEVV